MVVSKISAWRLKALSAFGITKGARDIDSTPPAIMSCASPVRMVRAAIATASSPEPHSRFTVAPGTATGKPPLDVARDEHPRPETTLEQLAALPTPFRANGTVTAGNASGVNDGACALLIASESAVRRWSLTPRARIVAAATAGVEPRIMGMGPVPATRKVLALARLSLAQLEVIELNEAFASQALAVLRELGLPDDAAHVNPNGGAIALGHPLGASGARLATTATWQLQASGGRYALCTMCIGVGQGIALVLERV